MAIDKIFPKSLNTDSEERVLKEGSMTDAMNITIAEDGGGTSVIAKNVRGTIPGEPLSDTDGVLNNKRIVAIGSASDSQRGFIYYIVADASGSQLQDVSNTEHAIYQYNVTNDTYRIVLKDARFNFNAVSFVKVDIVNADFARNGGLQTVLFFTDNANPPRKINVDRAMTGVYSGISNSEFEYSFNCIKAPNVYEPKASFTTDTALNINMFKDEAFQFATQLVYKDGEESAISPYSNLVIPTQLSVHNISEIGFGLGPNADNVCIINPNISAEDLLTSPDVSELRILYRSGNNGAFSVADEVSLNTITTRFVNGVSVEIFDGSSNYRFYNDRVATPVAPSEVNKLFDNVPFEAKGQAVSGNRLIYSNYTEGRENVGAKASLNVKYKSAGLLRTDLIDQSDQEFDETGEADIPTNSITTDSINGGAGITVKLKEAFGMEDASNEELESFIIKAGTIVSMSVEAPMNIPDGTEIPVDFQYLAIEDGIIDAITEGPTEYWQDYYEQNNWNCQVSITSIVLDGVADQLQTINAINEGLHQTPYYPLNQDGTLKIPLMQLQFVVPEDLPFISFDGSSDFFGLFAAQMSEISFSGSYYAKIKGTQDVWGNVDSHYVAAVGGTVLKDDIFSEIQPLGETMDAGFGTFPTYATVTDIYQPTDYTSFAYYSGHQVNYSPGVNYDTWQREDTGLIDLYFKLRVEANPITGNIVTDIVPYEFRPYSGNGSDYNRRPRIILVGYPNEYLFGVGPNQESVNNGTASVTAQNAEPMLFTTPEVIPIEWPEDTLMPIDGGFIHNDDDPLYPSLPLTQSGWIQSTDGQAGYFPTEAGVPPYFLLGLIAFYMQPSGTYLFEKELRALSRSQMSGFKAGALHNIGVVYYDKFNRSGFVNELGNVYVDWFNKQGDDFRGDWSDGEDYLDGPAAIEVRLNSTPPEWAETYQIVYPGNSSISEFVQYTVGGCYPARVKHDTTDVIPGDSISTLPARDIDINSKRLYVSLETLDQYRSEKNTFRDYSYTEGDRLRIVSHAAVLGSNISAETDEDELVRFYKGASDDSIIEFNVVGVELLAKDIDNPIAHNPSGGALADGNALQAIPDHMTGKFLVLESTPIAASATGLDGLLLKYPGYDWNHVSSHFRETTLTQGAADANQSDFDYLPFGDNAPTSTNSWKWRAIAEIYTAKLSAENKVYYEIGEKRHIGKYEPPYPANLHGPSFIVESGDINFRPTWCKTLAFEASQYGASASFKEDFKDYKYIVDDLESFTVSDKLGEKMWSKGRPHVKYDNAATFRRFNGVTYSDAYAEDVDKFSLSSFNATLANFYSLDSQYGACNYISNYGSEQRGFDELLSIQENKFAKTPVNKSILLDASGANNVALSTNVLATTTYYTGDYGCGDHPESVLVQDNDVYFFDRSRKKVLRFSGNQLVPISDKGVSSTINDATDAFNEVFDRKSGKIISGFNPDDNVYYITFRYPQDFSYKSGDDTKLVPLYTTTDLNQDGIPNEDDLNIFVNTYTQVAAGDITSNEAAELYTTTTDISFEALDPENPDVFTLSNAATIDISSIGPDATSPQDGVVNANDFLTFLLYYGVTAPITAEIDGATYIQYVNILDADGDPIPALFNGQPMFVNVDTNEVVFSNNEPIQGTEIPYSTPEEYRDFITLSYNAEGNFWQSRNSYYPDIYANQDNKMYTAKYVIDSDHPSPDLDGNALMFHRHEDLKTASGTILNRCTFYNQPTSESFIELVSNANPSSAKVYDALSYEGDSAKLTARIESFLGNEKGIANIPQTAFTKKEGSYYSAIGGDISGNSTNQIRLLGYVLEVGENQITINDAPAGAIQGAVLKTVDDFGVLFDIGVDGEEVLIQGDITTVANGVTVDLNGPVDESVVNTTIVMELPRDRNGDSIRGHYAKIKLSTNEGENVGKYELFCVNAHVTPSDLHHIN